MQTLYRYFVFFALQREKLIAEVRKYPYLYDLSDAKYSNTIKKDEPWKQISITLKQSGKYLLLFNYLFNVFRVCRYVWEIKQL